MAWMAEYMDNFYQQHPSWAHVQLKQLPSYYMDHNVYGSFIRDTYGIRHRDAPGGKNIMWSSDYPHSETTWPESKGWIDRMFDGVGAEDRQAILCGNAQRFYGLS
jgi:hypothetical protein